MKEPPNFSFLTRLTEDIPYREFLAPETVIKPLRKPITDFMKEMKIEGVHPDLMISMILYLVLALTSILLPSISILWAIASIYFTGSINIFTGFSVVLSLISVICKSSGVVIERNGSGGKWIFGYALIFIVYSSGIFVEPSFQLILFGILVAGISAIYFIIPKVAQHSEVMPAVRYLLIGIGVIMIMCCVLLVRHSPQFKFDWKQSYECYGIFSAEKECHAGVEYSRIKGLESRGIFLVEPEELKKVKIHKIDEVPDASFKVLNAPSVGSIRDIIPSTHGSITGRTCYFIWLTISYLGFFIGSVISLYRSQEHKNSKRKKEDRDEESGLGEMISVIGVDSLKFGAVNIAVLFELIASVISGNLAYLCLMVVSVIAVGTVAAYNLKTTAKLTNFENYPGTDAANYVTKETLNQRDVGPGTVQYWKIVWTACAGLSILTGLNHYGMEICVIGTVLGISMSRYFPIDSTKLVFFGCLLSGVYESYLICVIFAVLLAKELRFGIEDVKFFRYTAPKEANNVTPTVLS